MAGIAHTYRNMKREEADQLFAGGKAITPNDSSDIDSNGDHYYAIYIGVTGDVKFDLLEDDAVIFKNMLQGHIHRLIFKRVYATDTDATDMVALR